MKKIAVFTSHVYEPMCAITQKGINAAALDCGVKVIYFSSFSDSYSGRSYVEYNKYDQGDNVSFDIPDLNDFDGIIKISTYFSESVKVHLKQILSKTDKPVINIGGFDPDYMNIVCDDTHSFNEIVSHLIEKHNCKDIYHLAGIPGKHYTQERLEAYKSALMGHDIDFDESKVYYGTLWRDCGDDAFHLAFSLTASKNSGSVSADATLSIRFVVDCAIFVVFFSLLR